MEYTFTIGQDTEHDGSVYYFAEVNEIPGCLATGQSHEEALENIEAALHDWLETASLLQKKQ